MSCITCSDGSFLEAIETLRTDEKLSFIFLISSNHKESLSFIQELKSAASTMEENGLFRQFLLGMLLKDRDDFFSLCIESLILIKNYRILRLVGVNSARMEHYVGRVNQTQKQLYVLAESLTAKQTAEFVFDVSGQGTDSCLLEETVLRWVADGIVSLEVDNAESILKRRIKSGNSKDLLKLINNNATTGHATDVVSSEEFYPIINSDEKGFCVIINQNTFTRSSKYSHLLPEETLSPRYGSDIDVKSMSAIFSWLGFKIFKHENLSFMDLKHQLSTYASLIPTHHSFFVLVLMSHGTEDVIYTADSLPIKVEEIEMVFQAENCPNLVNKPKILIVQACQGKRLQRIMFDGIANYSHLPNPSVRPERGDAVIAWSTVKGYASFRDRLQGSWFIQELCSELKKSAHNRDLVDIVTRVNSNLRYKSFEGLYMVPSLSISLCKKIKFFN